MFGTFLLLYCILALYGAALLYIDVRRNGCDPSGTSTDVDTCTSNGAGVFGAMLGTTRNTTIRSPFFSGRDKITNTFFSPARWKGVAFSAQGASQFGSFVEAFTQARVAAYIALQVIRRRPGAPEETIFSVLEDDADVALNSSTHSQKSSSIKSIHTACEAKSNDQYQPEIMAILPKYEIDCMSTAGLKPENIKGFISFKDVTFAYPTRPHEIVLNKMSVEIEAGKVVAFVGPRYDTHTCCSISISIQLHYLTVNVFVFTK